MSAPPPNFRRHALCRSTSSDPVAIFAGYRTRRALQLCYYALSSSDASFTAQKFAKVSISRKFKVAKITFATPPKPQVLRTCKLYEWIPESVPQCLMGVRFLYSAGKVPNAYFGPHGLQGRSPCTEARRALTPLLPNVPLGCPETPRSFSPARASVT